MANQAHNKALEIMGYGFDDYNIDIINSQLRKDIREWYISNSKTKNKKGLAIFGNPGKGKSYSVFGIIKLLYQNYYKNTATLKPYFNVKYNTMIGYIEEYNNYMFNNSKANEDSAFKELFGSYTHVVIDDLNAETNSDITVFKLKMLAETFVKLVNNNKVLIITSNSNENDIVKSCQKNTDWNRIWERVKNNCDVLYADGELNKPN